MVGLLLINLGTPDAPTTRDVRRYLREFLSDPRVIDIHPIGRSLLLNLVILPFRPAKSAAQYRKIWGERGSPLLTHTLDLRDEVAARLGDGWRVEVGMRYGSPSIPDALATLRAAGADRVVVFPLFPQYASSSTGTALEVVYRHTARAWNTAALSVVEPFFDDPLFIDAFAKVGAPALAEAKPDHVLFSFHGLPERQIRKSDTTGDHCLTDPDHRCCSAVTAPNRSCYRAHCTATATALADRLGLEPDSWTVTFQSRLGRTPWIRPYTDVVLPELAAAGKRRLAVFCPAFVADCLETLEEIGIRAVDQFRAAGGEALTLVPSLNSSAAWADAVAAIASRHIPAAGDDGAIHLPLAGRGAGA